MELHVARQTLPYRGGGEEETFLWLPVFGAEAFPVFCHSGGRSYDRTLSRCRKGGSHDVLLRFPPTNLNKEEVESHYQLARALAEAADSLPRQKLLWMTSLVDLNQWAVIHMAHVFIHLSNFVNTMNICSLATVAGYMVGCSLRFFWLINGVNHRALEESATQSSFPTSDSSLGTALRRLGDCIVSRDSDAASTHLVAQSLDQKSKEITPDRISLSSTPSSEFDSSSSSQKIFALFHRLHAANSEEDGAKNVFELSSVEDSEEECDGAALSLPPLHTSSTSSSPERLLTGSWEEFTPELLSADDEEEESFRFQCSCPGLYQCSVTGLLFHMDGEGDVLYRTVPWNRRLLAQHHKQPAGPLFDIQCVQQCVRQLHLPHCEIHSTAAAPFLSVAHVTDEGVDFIRPHQVTETHLVVNISGFSAFGNVKDADAPPGPVRALVLLFYRPPAQEELESLLKILLLPGNVVVLDVVHYRKKLCADECYLETSSCCRLQPQQEYTLSTCPEEDWLLVQPTQAEFDSDGYDNYIPSFEVTLERILKHLKLIVRDIHSSHSVWERRVCLRSAGVHRSCDQGPSSQRLMYIRSSFINGISAPVLKSLLDKLLEKQVLSDSEKDEVSKPQSERDRARYVIDSVRKKGDAASSVMIDFLCELDPFLCRHLGLS